MEEITTNSWRRIESQLDLPEKRHHTLSLVGTSLVVYGGSVGEQPVADLLVLKNLKVGWEKKTWGGAVSPPPLSHHSAVEFGLRLYIIGGRTAAETNSEIFVYNQVTNVWIKARQLGDTMPPARSSHATSAIARLIYLFGGSSSKGEVLGDFWSYNTDTNFWTTIPSTNGPTARRGHSLTLAKGVLYVFGGTTAKGPSNELFSWNPQTNAWIKHQSVGHVPPPTTGHVTFAVGRHIYILGGETPEGAQREVYALDTARGIEMHAAENFAWQRMGQLSNVCCARRGHAACYNSNEHVLFVTGGSTEALGFTQPSFDTFARRIEININPSFIPAPEDAAIARTPTTAAFTKPKPDQPSSLPGAASIVYRPVAALSPSSNAASPSPTPSPSVGRPNLDPAPAARPAPSASPSRPSVGVTPSLLSTDTVRSSHDHRAPSPNASRKDVSTPEPETKQRASTTGRSKGSRIARQLPSAEASDTPAPLSARGSTSGNANSPATGFFGSLKKKLNPGPVPPPSVSEPAEAKPSGGDELSEVSNQEDGSVSKDSEKQGSHVQDDRSGGNAAKDAAEALPPETKQLLSELEAEAIIRALLPLSKDFFVTKKLKTYHHVFCGGDAVTWLEKNLFVPRPAGVIYFQRLLDEGWFVHVPAERPFMDGSSHHYQLSEKALSLRPTAVVLHASDSKKETEKKKDEDDKAKSEGDKKPEGDDAEAKEKDSKEKKKAADEEKKRAEEEEKKRKEEERKRRREKKEKTPAPESEISITGPTAVIYSSKEAAPVPVSAPKPAPKQKTEEEVEETAEQIAKKDTHRQEVLKELIATEKDYIRDLGIIVNLYMEPLQNEHKTLIKPNEFAAVFSTVNMLPPLNQELVGKLEKTKELPPGDQTVGQVFLEMHPYFKLYMGYCTNHAASLSTLKKLKNNAPFAAFIEEVRQKPECRKLDIEAYLIKPLQRICRYPLLLKEIYKDMPRKHRDRSSLNDAIDKIEQVVREVNEAKRLAEHLNQVVEIQNSFVFPDANTEIVTSSRRLVREAQVKKLTSGIMSETSDRIFFLFNDLLLIGTEKLGKNIGLGKKYQFKQMHPIETIILWDVKDGDGGKHVKNAFTIVRTDKKDKQTYMVNTKEDKDQLVAAINECIINIPNLGKDKKDTREVREAAFAAFKKTLA